MGPTESRSKLNRTGPVYHHVIYSDKPDLIYGEKEHSDWFPERILLHGPPRWTAHEPIPLIGVFEKIFKMELLRLSRNLGGPKILANLLRK